MTNRQSLQHSCSQYTALGPWIVDCIPYSPDKHDIRTYVTISNTIVNCDCDVGVKFTHRVINLRDFGRSPK